MNGEVIYISSIIQMLFLMFDLIGKIGLLIFFIDLMAIIFIINLVDG